METAPHVARLRVPPTFQTRARRSWKEEGTVISLMVAAGCASSSSVFSDAVPPIFLTFGYPRDRWTLGFPTKKNLTGIFIEGVSQFLFPVLVSGYREIGLRVISVG